MDTIKKSNFDIALAWIFHAEGGDSDDADDPGGTTRYGISLRYLKTKGVLGDIDGDGDIDDDDIRALTKEDAAKLYQLDFWYKSQCDQLPFPLALILFDQAVNTGVITSVRILQEYVGAYVDGIIGKNTIAKATAKFNSNPKWFIASYMARRARYYTSVTSNKPKLIKYLNGWFTRLFDLQLFIVENI